MLDEKKIILNSLRSFKKKNKKVNLFYNNLSEEAIQRLEIDKNFNCNILEILPKNNIFSEKLQKKNYRSNVCQTFFSNAFKLNKKKFIIIDDNLSAIENEKFDYCISFFPAFNKSELTSILKSTHRVLKSNGKFLFLFFSSDSCMKLKNIFYDIFKSRSQNMFVPSPDILLLGNITSAIGYKNVVVDKSNFIIKNSYPQDLWNFIRDLGLSNYLSARNRKTISKNNYHKLCKTIKLLLTENGKITNKVSINYLIGTKKN